MKKFDTEALAALRTLLANRTPTGIRADGLRPAAVLLCLIESNGGWSLVFSKRSDELPVHSGQISFPGGAIERGESPAEAAIRETEEEVGIPRDRIELIGRLDDLIARTGYIVSPFVGLVPSGSEYTIQPTEVVEVFEVPISVLISPENPEIRYIGYKGRTYPVYVYHHQHYEIWGVTGRILKGFLDLLRLTV